MHVTVTGAHGFIGRAVVNELHRRGYEYTLRDIALSATHDVRNPDLSLNGDAVIHLAGILGTHELFDRVDDAIDINVRGAANVVRICERRRMKYVGISMMDVWNNVYQATKLAGERIALAWNQHKGLPVSIVRAYNGYGPYQKVRGVQKIAPTFATKAWNNESIPIWGDGSNTTDLVHVDDIARMLVDATSFGDGEVFDAGTGVPISVKDVAEFVVEHTGSKAGVEYLPMRRGEHYLDEPLVAKGQGWELLDWKPEFDWDRFAETIDWYKTPRP
jgi:UDP-glucose 4-epimerase